MQLQFNNMEMKKANFYNKQEITISLGTPFATEEMVVVRSNTHKMGEIVKMLVIEFD